MAAIRDGALAGVVTGAMWIGSLMIETFAGLSGWASIEATAPGAVAAQRHNSIPSGVVGAVTAATICVAATIAFGLALAYIALPTLERNINGSPEYLASHWGDLHAFAIANTLDAACQHLVIAPLIAAFVGALGALFVRRLPPTLTSKLAR